jgi:hypothetical protein
MLNVIISEEFVTEGLLSVSSAEAKEATDLKMITRWKQMRHHGW